MLVGIVEGGSLGPFASAHGRTLLDCGGSERKRGSRMGHVGLKVGQKPAGIGGRKSLRHSNSREWGIGLVAGFTGRESTRKNPPKINKFI